jgi:hypothetical protein
MYTLPIATIYLTGISMLVCVLAALVTRRQDYWVKARGLAAITVFAGVIAVLAESLR